RVDTAPDLFDNERLWRRLDVGVDFQIVAKITETAERFIADVCRRKYSDLFLGRLHNVTVSGSRNLIPRYRRDQEILEFRVQRSDFSVLEFRTDFICLICVICGSKDIERDSSTDYADDPDDTRMNEPNDELCTLNVLSSAPKNEAIPFR